MERKRVILKPLAPLHRAIKMAAAKSEKSINELCLSAIEKDKRVKEALNG